MVRKNTLIINKRFWSSDGGKTAGAAEKQNKNRERQNMLPMLAEVTTAAAAGAAGAADAVHTVGVSGSLHVGLAALGAAIGVGIIGMKASEAVGRNPGAATKILVQAILSTAFAEGIVFFAIFLVK